MEGKSHKAAMVLDREFGNKLVELSKRMHVWACDSSANLEAVNKIIKDTKAHDIRYTTSS